MKKLFYLKQLQLITLIITVIVIFITSAISSFAVSLEEIENQINKNESQKESIKNQLSSLKEQIEAQKKQDSAITAEMVAVLKEKQQEKDKLKQMLEDLDYIYEQIEEYYENIEETEKRYNEALKAFYSRAKVMYQYSQYNSLRLFVESKDYFDYVNREKMFSKMMNNDAEKLISEKQAVIKAIENNESNIYERLEISKNAIDTLEAQEQAMIEESKKIEKKINELEKLYEEYSYSGSGLMWPSRNSTRIASYYGWREVHPVYGYGRMHYGIDIDAAYGTDILSSADGVVTLVLFDDVGYGWYIIVYHGDGISTLYAHCSKVLVKEGQNVKQGQVLGLVGTTGASTGPHIHYEVRINGKPQNPLDYVKPK